jgi:hypothetical protein
VHLASLCDTHSPSLQGTAKTTFTCLLFQVNCCFPVRASDASSQPEIMLVDFFAFLFFLNLLVRQRLLHSIIPKNYGSNGNLRPALQYKSLTLKKGFHPCTCFHKEACTIGSSSRCRFYFSIPLGGPAAAYVLGMDIEQVNVCDHSHPSRSFQ